MTTLLDSADARLGGLSFAALVRAFTVAAGSTTAAEALRALADAAQAVSEAEVAVVRALDESGERLEAAAVAAPNALAAELYGTALLASELPEAPLDDLARAPVAVRRLAEHAGASQLLLVPARSDGYAVSVELYRPGEPFGAEQRIAAELCAGQALLVLRAFAGGGDISSLARPALELAGEALAVVLQKEDAAAEVVRLAAVLTGAAAAVLWESRTDGFVTAASWGKTSLPVSTEPVRSRNVRSPSPDRSRHMSPGSRGIARSRPRCRSAGRRSASCSSSIPRARSRRRSSSPGSRRSASASRTLSVRASARGCSRSSSSARGRCST